MAGRTDFDRADTFVQRITLTSGGDDPESVFDGTVRMIDSLDWREDAHKMILVLGDAPSLLPPLSTYTIDDVIKRSKAHGILMNYYPVVLSPLPPGSKPMLTPYHNQPMINTIYPVPTAGN